MPPQLMPDDLRAAMISPDPSTLVLRLADIGDEAPAALLARYGLTLQHVADGEPIPGSYWGDEEAGIIGCTLAYTRGIGYLPIAALDGLFLYMGIASFGGNTFFSRLVLFFTDNTKLDARRLPFLGRVPMSVVRRFTLVQLFILLCIFTITFLPFVAALFPC